MWQDKDISITRGEVMERAEMSRHQVVVFVCVKKTGHWMSNKAIMAQTGLPARTVRHHTHSLVALGIFDQMELFPEHVYRFSTHADKRNKSYLQRLEMAHNVFQEIDAMPTSS
jgi:hypothetical protein